MSFEGSLVSAVQFDVPTATLFKSYVAHSVIVVLINKFAAREIDLFQTYCSCTSPSSAAINGPVQRANPAGGSRSI
jgi:hypothetical protein